MADQPPAPPLHPTSIAVWAVPSPVVVGSRFTVTIGVKCASGCRLTGLPVVVRDADGAAVGQGRFGEAPAPGTRALYAAEVALEASEVEGVHSRTASFAGRAPTGAEEAGDAAHAAASSTFSFRASSPPDHRVTVTVWRTGYQDAGRPGRGAGWDLPGCDRCARPGRARCRGRCTRRVGAEGRLPTPRESRHGDRERRAPHRRGTRVRRRPRRRPGLDVTARFVLRCPSSVESRAGFLPPGSPLTVAGLAGSHVRPFPLTRFSAANARRAGG